MTSPTHRDYLPDEPREIQDLIYRSAKIEAIKEIRASRGLGLKEAKDAVEDLERRMRDRFPNAMPPSRGSGCFTVAMLLSASLVGAAMSAWWRAPT
ncbi:MAG: ribosomal protein L7/L12 [Phycisphaerales bacterium]